MPLDGGGTGARGGSRAVLSLDSAQGDRRCVPRGRGPVEVYRPRKGGFAWNWRGREWFADLERVARLRSPVTLMHLKAHPALRDAGWIRNNLVGRARVTVDWMFLRELIVERHAGMQRVLPCVQGQGF